MLQASGASQDIASLLRAPRDKAPPAARAEIESADELLASVYNNIAACHVALERWDRAVVYADKTIELTPANAKALYRRGLALLRTGKLDRALDDLTRACREAPQDAGFRKAYEEARAAVAEDKKTSGGSIALKV